MSVHVELVEIHMCAWRVVSTNTTCGCSPALLLEEDEQNYKAEEKLLYTHSLAARVHKTPPPRQKECDLCELTPKVMYTEFCQCRQSIGFFSGLHAYSREGYLSDAAIILSTGLAKHLFVSDR